MFNLHDFGYLLEFDPMKHNNSLIGKSFLTPTGSVMIVGPSGVGKSKFIGHLAFSLAIGLDFLGMEIHRPCRVLMLQAEDVVEDLAESLQGFVRHNLKGDPDAIEQLKANLNIATVAGDAGDKFIRLLDAACEKYLPEVVVIDPLLAFMGCDLVDQGAVTRFLREQLAQISYKYKCAMICAHHAKKDKGGAAIERAFGGIEFSAFFRGIIDLSADPKDYRCVQMRVAKRQRQLELKDAMGSATDCVSIKMGKDGVYWTIDEHWAARDLESTGGREPKVAKTEIDKTIVQAKKEGLADPEIIKRVASQHGYSDKQAGRYVKAASEKLTEE